MEELKNQKGLKFKLPIVILTFISIACVLWVGCRRIIISVKMAEWLVDEMLISEIIASIISMIVFLAPCVLLLIYILKFYEHKKATVLMPITFGLVAVFSNFYSIYNRLHQIVSFTIESIVYSESVAEMLTKLIENLRHIRHPYYFTFTRVFLFAVFILFVLVTVEALSGLRRKMVLVAACSMGVFTTLFLIIDRCGIFGLSAIKAVLNTVDLKMFIAPIALYAALLLFGLNNKIPVIMVRKKKNVEKMSPEQALKTLKEEFELGMITEEEYHTQRAKIINKL